jgi:hypothetical protein
MKIKIVVHKAEELLGRSPRHSRLRYAGRQHG